MDKYDEAIAYLTERPVEITKAWNKPHDHPGGCLFGFASVGPGDEGTMQCGCLTQIRGSDWVSDFGEEHTAKIRSDMRIPSNPNSIRVEHLAVFAEHQREMDRMREELKASA